MSINLQKGQKIDLTKTNPGLTEVCCALGWRETIPTDLDVYAIAVDANNAMVGLCFFNDLTIFGGALSHSGDNRTGAGDGDDETVTVQLANIPANVQKILFSLNIFEAKPDQNLGMVRDAFIRVYDKVTGNELMRYDLSEDYSVFQGVNVAELYRNGGEWKFGAVTAGYLGDINNGIALL